MSARVLAQYRGHWLVAPDDEDPRLVPARGRLTDTPVTGDYVGLDDGGAIAAIEPRRGAIVRRAPGEVTSGQVLAANVDLALVTEPLPGPKARRLERFAALAASGGVQVTGESFADVDGLALQCRFADCGHETEPGCAVRANLDEEPIAAWRKLQRELEWVEDRRAASRAREARHREISPYLRTTKR
jgi:putative ribosome biogenesis GTPase RsgA